MRTLLLACLIAASTTQAFAHFEQVPIPAEANTYNLPPRRGKSLPIVVISCAVIAGCLIFFAYKEEGDPEGPHLYVLEEDVTMAGNWQEVGRITVALAPKKAKALLAARVHKEDDFPHNYRLKDMGPAL